MALIHVPPADSPTASDRLPPTDEIIDLADRRRVMLYAVLGMDVDETAANEIFEVRSSRRATSHRPPMVVESGLFAVGDLPVG